MYRSVGFVVRRTVGTGVILVIALAAVAQGLRDQPEGATSSPLLYRATVKHLAGQEVLAKPTALVYVQAPPSPKPASTSAPRASALRGRPQTSVARRPVVRATRPVRAGAFPYGQCTWYVAQRRYIPWSGNAWQWWWNAAAYGFHRGWKPRAGAIMVMGYSWSSPWGHVAYVERVYGDGSFLVSEMNWWGVRGGGWGRVDYRVIRSMRDVVGFIY